MRRMDDAKTCLTHRALDEKACIQRKSFPYRRSSRICKLHTAYLKCGMATNSSTAISKAGSISIKVPQLADYYYCYYDYCYYYYYY